MNKMVAELNQAYGGYYLGDLDADPKAVAARLRAVAATMSDGSGNDC